MVVGCTVVEVTGPVVLCVVIVVGVVPGVPGLVSTQDPSIQTPPWIKVPGDVGRD